MSEAEAEAGSMASVVVSLSKSVCQVPPPAVPAMLDCILVSTGLSPPSLFASLLHDFPRILKVPLILLLDLTSISLIYFVVHILYYLMNFNRMLSKKVMIWMLINAPTLCRWWACFVIS